MIRRFKIGRNTTSLLILFAFLVVISVLGGRETSVDVEPELPPLTRVDLIAFRDTESQIQLIKPDGTDPRLLTPISESVRQGFTWPSWSSNSSILTYTKIKESAVGLTMSLENFELKTGNTTSIHSGIASQIAAGVFYYSFWSPDDKNLAFIFSDNGSLNLYVDRQIEDVAPINPSMIDGPIWMDWSFDSNYLLAHRNTGHFLLDVSNTPISVKSLDLNSSSYRTPSWQPGTTKGTLLNVDGFGVTSMLIGDLSKENFVYEEFLNDIHSDATFSWSPDSRNIAIGGPQTAYIYLGLAIGVHSGIKIYDRNYDPLNSLNINEPVIAYFWSPDSSKLVYVSIADSPGTLRWMVLDRKTGLRWPLVDFVPSLDQLTLFQYYDQYSKSHSIWSPDSRQIVFAGREAGLAIGASFPPTVDGENPLIYVVYVDQSPIVSAIADGVMATWSPR